MKKILKAITNLFTKVFAGVIGTARRFVKPAVLVVELLKKVVESQITWQAAQLTRTNIDNAIILIARKLLPEILNMLQLTTDCLGKDKSNDEIIQCALDKVKLLHPDAQKSTWLAIAGHLSAGFSDGRFTFAETVGLAWLIYHKEVKPVK